MLLPDTTLFFFYIFHPSVFNIINTFTLYCIKLRFRFWYSRPLIYSQLFMSTPSHRGWHLRRPDGGQIVWPTRRLLLEGPVGSRSTILWMTRCEVYYLQEYMYIVDEQVWCLLSTRVCLLWMNKCEVYYLLEYIICILWMTKYKNVYISNT